MNNPTASRDSTGPLDGCRILILTGAHDGEEGVCLGRAADGLRWGVSPDTSSAILDLVFTRDFALLLDLSASPALN